MAEVFENWHYTSGALNASYSVSLINRISETLSALVGADVPCAD